MSEVCEKPASTKERKERERGHDWVDDQGNPCAGEKSYDLQELEHVKRLVSRIHKTWTKTSNPVLTTALGSCMDLLAESVVHVYKLRGWTDDVS
jgi:hypothetical protein